MRYIFNRHLPMPNSSASPVHAPSSPLQPTLSTASNPIRER